MKTHIPQTNPTNKLLLTAVAALALALPSTLLLAQDQGSTNGDTNSQMGPNHPPDGPPLLPPRAVEALNLTDDQKQQLKDLQEEVKTKLEAILTPAQLDQLKQMRAKRRQGWGGPKGGGTPPPPPSTNQPAS
jgi:Spy/CpxP family protein refolding chaperone